MAYVVSPTGRSMAAWPVMPGRTLDMWPRVATRDPVVALMNVWQDAECLKRTMPTWAMHVDHIVAFDGAYRGVPVSRPDSTDDTVAIINAYDHSTVIPCTGFWDDQCAKRTAMLEYAAFRFARCMVWIIDADESVAIHPGFAIPQCDVGWVRITSPMYQRAQYQPRVFRVNGQRPGLRYQGRHHWIFRGDDIVTTHQQGAPGVDHAVVNGATMHNSRGGDDRPLPRRLAAQQHRAVQMDAEQRVGWSQVGGHEPLQIMQLGPFDAGGVMFRLHTAINSTTPHTSMMATDAVQWTGEPRQWSLRDARDVLGHRVGSADVVHHHVNRIGADVLRIPPGVPTIMHHHGTEYRNRPEYWNDRDADAVVRFVSNLELLQYAPDGLTYLPNPVPVQRYAAWAAPKRPRWGDGPLRVVQTPSKPAKKNTDALLTAVGMVRARGVDIDVRVVTGVPMRDAMEAKASAHVVFDSFWLGMQCSGLEAAAMGAVVIAGDPDCHRGYTNWVGHVPYTYANTVEQLADVLEQLATDGTFYHGERDRVMRHVVTHHDYGAVSAAYLNALDHAALGWRDQLAIGMADGPLRLDRH